MAINKEEFKHYEKRSFKDDVADFFKANKSQAFKSNEVARALGVKNTFLSRYLHTLKIENKLDHKTPYWIWIGD